MRRVLELISRVKDQRCPVLILGETGTGKEVVARSIHYWGTRRLQPFVPVDCAAIAPTLIETELFGCVKGAYTGADSNRAGLLETARKGSLFLDEIGEMPLEMQAKMLRTLQEKEIRPVGSSQITQFGARVIAATNRDLRTEVARHHFRSDLFYRLDVVEIHVPPLRDRKSDIPQLAQWFLEKYQSPDEAKSLPKDVVDRLMAYSWPGNVRELENVIERAVALSLGRSLSVEELPPEIQPVHCSEPSIGDDELLLETLEGRTIRRALRITGGHIVEAARLLGMGKTTLYRRLRRLEDAHKSESGRDADRTEL